MITNKIFHQIPIKSLDFLTVLHMIQISTSWSEHDEVTSHRNLFVYNPYKVFHKWNVNKIHIAQSTLI